MILHHLLDEHAGRHAANAAALFAVPALFRRCWGLVRRQPDQRRKLAVPGVTSPAPGTAVQPAWLTESQTMATGEFAALDAKVDALRRPVNGRSLPDQPRTHPDPPAYGRDPVARVLAAEQQAALDLSRQARIEADRAWYFRSQMPAGMGAPDLSVLARVRDALRRDVPDATYRGGWQ